MIIKEPVSKWTLGWTDGPKFLLAHTSAPVEFRTYDESDDRWDGFGGMFVGSTDEMVEYIKKFKPHWNGSAIYVAHPAAEELIAGLEKLRPNNVYFTLSIALQQERELIRKRYAVNSEEQDDRRNGTNSKRGRKTRVCSSELF